MAPWEPLLDLVMNRRILEAYLIDQAVADVSVIDM